MLNVAELRKKSREELNLLLVEQLKELFKLRMQKSSDQLKTVHFMGITKRQIARIKTLMNEKKVGN